ncbi:MAG: DUF2202 domain-containing protein [Thermoflexales bacterium]|nr:DUF2202 domain-containing protein [Thermoflexales bacterium]
MFKKILIGTVLMGLIGVLVVGAVIRTASVTGVAEARGQGYGRGEQVEPLEGQVAGQGYGRGEQVEPLEGQVAGQGYGRGGQAGSTVAPDAAQAGGGWWKQAGSTGSAAAGQAVGGRWGQAGSTEHSHDADHADLNDRFGPPAAGALSEAEIEGLFYMREEEKLARDVYLALYQKWGQRSFQNIANSEQTHTGEVLALIERYGLADPAADLPAGVFANATLQALYDQLVAEGSQSLASALRVGAAIEEIDILDLQASLAQTDRADIRSVYEDLLSGSHKHLRAFASTLNRQTGEIYQPQHLDQAAYDAIVDGTSFSAGASIERGQGRGRGGQN